MIEIENTSMNSNPGHAVVWTLPALPGSVVFSYLPSSLPASICPRPPNLFLLKHHSHCMYHSSSSSYNMKKRRTEKKEGTGQNRRGGRCTGEGGDYYSNYAWRGATSPSLLLAPQASSPSFAIHTPCLSCIKPTMSQLKYVNSIYR